MTKPVSPTSSDTYHFRPSTKRQKEDLTYASPKRRKTLPPGTSATLQRTPGHDHTVLKEESSYAKMNVRIWATYTRFAIGHTWKCKTFRGTTHLNGSNAPCK